jgi:hypothetical protein
VLLGHEANSNTGRFMAGSISGLLNEDPSSRYIDDALGQAASKNVSSSGSFDRLLSFFGKADYNYGERYYVSGTLRRDGSSKFGTGNQWGTFPAFNVGWRASRESFFPQDGFFSNVMLRFGWGVTGNQQIPGGRIVAQFGGAVTRFTTSADRDQHRPGFRQVAIRNANLKRKSSAPRTGLDLEFDAAVHGGPVQPDHGQAAIRSSQPVAAAEADPAAERRQDEQPRSISRSLSGAAAPEGLERGDQWQPLLTDPPHGGLITDFSGGTGDAYRARSSTRSANRSVHSTAR